MFEDFIENLSIIKSVILESGDSAILLNGLLLKLVILLCLINSAQYYFYSNTLKV